MSNFCSIFHCATKTKSPFTNELCLLVHVLMSTTRKLESDVNEPLWRKQWMFVQVCLSLKGRRRVEEKEEEEDKGLICRANLSFTPPPPQLKQRRLD